MIRIILFLIVIAFAATTASDVSACQRASARCLVKSFSGGAAVKKAAPKHAPLPRPQPVQKAGHAARAATGLTKKFADHARQTSRTLGGIGNAVAPGKLTAGQVGRVGTAIGKLKSASGAARKAGDFATTRVIGAQIRKAEQAQAAARTLERAQAGKVATARMKRFNKAAAGGDGALKKRPLDKLEHARRENIYKMRKAMAARDRYREKRPVSYAGPGLSNPPASARSAFDKAKRRPPLRPKFKKAAARQGGEQTSGSQTGGAATETPALDLD